MNTRLILRRNFREAKNHYNSSRLSIDIAQIKKFNEDDFKKRQRNKEFYLQHVDIPLSQRQRSLCLKMEGKKIMQSEPRTDTKRCSLPNINKGLQRTITTIWLSITSPQAKISSKKEQGKSSIVLQNDTTYNTQRALKKETIVILYNIQEICKVIKSRGEDLIAIEKLMVDIASGDGLYRFIIDIKRKEMKRMSLEDQKISILQEFCTDDIDTKKTIVKSMKKALAKFERKYYHEELRSTDTSLKNQLNFIMNGEYSQNPPTSYDKTLNTILQYLFRESKMDIGFICELCSLYTRSLLKKKIKKLVGIFNKNIKLSQISFNRIVFDNNIEEAYKNCLIRAEQKLFKILCNRNRYIAENIKRFTNKVRINSQ